MGTVWFGKVRIRGMGPLRWGRAWCYVVVCGMVR